MVETSYLQAFYIAALEPDLNQDKGWHTLSPVYNSIIKLYDQGLPRGSHDRMCRSTHFLKKSHGCEMK